MKLGIISDTHDRLDSIAKALNIFKENKVNMIIHCGDWVSPFTLEFYDKHNQNPSIPTKSVFGNNEGDIKRIIERNAKLKNPIDFAPKIVFELKIGKRNIVVFHGHDKVILNALIESQKYDAVFTGHTHIPRNEYINNTLVLNPGSTAYVAQSRMIKKASVAVYDSISNRAKVIYLNKV